MKCKYNQFINRFGKKNAPDWLVLSHLLSARRPIWMSVMLYNNTKMTCLQVSLFQRKWLVGELITWLWIATANQNHAVVPLNNAIRSYIRNYMFSFKSFALCQSHVVSVKEAAAFSCAWTPTCEQVWVKSFYRLWPCYIFTMDTKLISNKWSTYSHFSIQENVNSRI